MTASRTPFNLPVDHPLSAMLYSHYDSPLQRGEASLEEYLDHSHSINQAIQENGGITVRETPGSEPLPVGGKRWYGVGGAKDIATGERYPEKVTDGGVNSTLAHVLDVERGNIDRAKIGWPAAHVGGWNEGGDTVLDATSVTKTKRQAMRLGYQRGERKVFDAKNIDELDVELDPRDVGRVKKNPGVS